MGAGSSAEQAGDKSPGTIVPVEAAEPGTPPEILVVLQEDQGAGDAKVLHKNGQISPINGTAEQQVEYSFQAEDLNGLEAEIVVPNVGQRESTSVSQKEQASEGLETMPQEESAAVEISPKDGQETIEEMPVSEEKQEQVEPSNEAQSNEVGFKKVFKFVGFRFTVKKDKSEKTEPVQLLTVKKDEVESNGTEKPEVKTPTPDEKPEAVESSKFDTLEAGKPNEDSVNAVEQVEEETVVGKSSLEAPTEKAEEENAGQNESQDAVEGEQELKKSPVSPTNPLVTETTSPFKKFFTQSWAGLKKRTSFKKTKEDEQQEKTKSETPAEASDSTVKLAEDHTTEIAETTAKQENGIAEEEKPETSIVDVKEPTEDPSVPLADISTDLKLEETAEESDVLIANAEIALDKHVQHEEERQVLEVESAPSAEAKSEHEVVIEASEIISKEGTCEIDDTAEKVKEDTAVLSSLEKSNEAQELEDVKPVDEVQDVKELPQIPEVSQEQEIEQSPPDAPDQKPSEGVSNEVELLSLQEKAKLQGSPLRKLFTGSSLKKLSGKKHKAKKEEEPKPEEATEQLQSSSEMPEAPEADKGDSIPSSPEEPVDALSSEKPQPEATQVSEGEGEGATSDGERKKDGITPWASFKKMVTPKKRVKKLSESDKEDEPEKAGKSATMSSTDSGNSDNQEETKVVEEEPKLEKSTEEPKRKVDSSVSWEALLCVGSSKKRARKCSDSDEEETQKPLEEKPHEDEEKTDVEAEKKAEPETEAVITTSQESDQGQGGSSPEQDGSPEGEGVSTWASFKRLVTPRRKSKTRMEEKVDESTAVVSAEQPTSEAEPGKDESWVSFKKLIPGRKKKKSDGKPEHALVEEGHETVEDEDGDVPAVVPLSEYEAAEQEKIEAQQALQTEIITKETTAPLSAPEEDLEQAEEFCDGLVHAVTVTVVEGERAVTCMEERSPSWISATVTETIEQDDLCKEVQQTKQAIETDVVIEPVVVVKTFDFVSSEVSGRTTAEMELTSEAVTALDEVMEASCAEETTEMVSAVSELSESQATTEESTPVPEPENSQQILEELQRQTQEVLKEVAEKVRHAEMVTSTREIEVTACPSQTNELDIKDGIQKDIVTMQTSAFDEGSLIKAELGKQEIDREQHFSDMQKVEVTVCRKVSEVIVETCLRTQELIEVDQSHMVEDEHERHDKSSIEEHGGEIGEVVWSTIERKDTVVNPSAVDLESVELLTGEEVKKDKLEEEEKVLEGDLVQKVQTLLASTFSITAKEFNVIEQKIEHAVQADGSEIIKQEIHLEMKEQPYVECHQTREVENILQTDVPLSVPEVIQEVAEMAGDESPCSELGAEQIEETACFNEVIETKAEGIQTILAQLVMLPQVNACEPALEQVCSDEKLKMEGKEFVSGNGEIEDNQSMFFNQVEEEMLPVQEEVIVEHIPEVDSSEAQVESILITAAAVEEKLVTETVTLLEASNVTLEPVDVTVTEFASISSEAPAVESQSEECTMESVSQTAAEILDAAFEAIASSTADTNLETVPASHGKEVVGDAKNEDVSQEIIESQIEVLGEEIISQVSIGLQTSTFMQDSTQTVIKEVSGFDEELTTNYAPETVSEADSTLSSGTYLEAQETKTDLHSEVKLSGKTVIEESKAICQINTVENLVSEATLLETITGQPEEKINISDDAQKLIIDCGVHGATDPVSAALEEPTTYSSNLSESESLEILPCVQEPIDIQVDLEHGELSHTVSIEPPPVTHTVQSIDTNATQEVEAAEDTVAIEATASALCLDATEKISDDAWEVKETVEELEPEFNVLQTEIEQGEVSCTVSIESHSSTIVEQIIQTAVEEVEKVEEEVSPSTVPEVECKADMDQSTKDPSELEVQEVEGEPIEEQKLVNVAIAKGSDFSHVVITESYRSTVVETIIMTTVEDEQLVCNSVSEVQSPVETDQSPEDACISEVQEVLKQTIEEPSIFQTENGHSEGSCTVSKESSHSTTVVETIIQIVKVGETMKEEAHKESEVPCEIESNRILNGTGDHEITVAATEEPVCSSEGQEEADILSSVAITEELKELLHPGLTQDIILSDTCEQQESTISFQVAVEPTEAVKPAHEVFEQVTAEVCQQTAAEVSIGQTRDIVLSDTCKRAEGTVSFQMVVETTDAIQPKHEIFEQLTAQVCQETAADANNDPPVMQPKLLKDEIALQGEEDGQQPGPESESQTQNVDGERPAGDAETTKLQAASSQECLEAAEQVKATETEKTVKIQEQLIVIDSVLPSQAGEEEQNQASEVAMSVEHVPHKHPHSTSESAES